MPRMHHEPGVRFGNGHDGLIGAELVAALLRLDPLATFGLVLLAAVDGYDFQVSPAYAGEQVVGLPTGRPGRGATRSGSTSPSMR